jgi:tRNA pseudouridine38-40 synthase
MGIEYDGSRFCGWQRQHETRTVQGEIERAVSFVANESIQVVCAGRTDTGVHGSEQIVHFDTVAERRNRSWVLGCNANLPDDVTVLWTHPVNEEFHARFSALSRRYRYVILNRFTRPAILAGRVCWEHVQLDAVLMQQAATHLLGEHDFTSYRALACQAKHAVREVRELNVSREGEMIYIDIVANAFLHHMVRNIAGVLIEIGSGERGPEWSRELLELRDRSVGGVTAPPGGLYLVSVEYPESWRLPQHLHLPRYG